MRPCYIPLPTFKNLSKGCVATRLKKTYSFYLLKKKDKSTSNTNKYLMFIIPIECNPTAFIYGVVLVLKV